MNTLALEISCTVSSTVETGCFFLWMSRRVRMSPLGFSAATRGLIQLVGVSTFSITVCRVLQLFIQFLPTTEWDSGYGLC